MIQGRRRRGSWPRAGRGARGARPRCPDSTSSPWLSTYAAVGDLERHVHVLLDDEHAGIGLVGDAPHDRQQALDDDRRQPEAHLVDEQALRLRRQRPGHRQHLLLAARQQAGEAVLQRDQGREHLHRPVVGDLRAWPGRSSGPRRMFSLTVRSKNSERSSATWARPRRGIVYGALARRPSSPSTRDGPLDRAQQPGDRQQRRRLAGAVRAEQGDDLAGVDVQGRGRGRPGCRRSRRAGPRCRSAGSVMSWLRPRGAVLAEVGARAGLRLAGRLAEVGALITAGSARTCAGVPWAMTARSRARRCSRTR